MTTPTLSTAGSGIGTGGYTWAVLVYLLAAYWITQRGLSDWVSSADLNFFLIQPIIWLGLAFLAHAGWRSLPDARPTRGPWLATAAVAGVVYVGVLVLGGIVGSMRTVRSGIDWIAYIENTWYVASLLIGIEVARTYLFHAWNKQYPKLVWPVVVVLFFAMVTPYAQFSAVDSLDRLVELTASSFIPTLGISLLATWFANHGSMWCSLAFRAPILAFLWYSLVQPDLHWSTTLAVGVAAAAVAYALAGPLAAALTEPEAAA